MRGEPNSISDFADAVCAGDQAKVRSMLASRPELIGMDRSGGDEHRGIHYAVLGRNAAMVRILMEAGADARKGIWPHRDATTAMTLARDRGYSEIVAIIEDEERHRREELSCLNATVTAQQDQISSAISRSERALAISLLETDLSQIQACDRSGKTPLHVAAAANDLELVQWLIDRRANVRKVDADGRTPLDAAALAADPRSGSAESFSSIATLLLTHGAELTPTAAVALGKEESVRQMITPQPDLLRRISSRGGLLTVAVKHHQIAIVNLLLDLGADVNERMIFKELEEPTESWGMPLWHAALAGDYPISKVLLDRGADPNANVYASGWPLRNAWDHEDDSVKRLLLERGAKVQPYMLSEEHDIEGAKALLANGATEQEIHEVIWSAADSGCPEILNHALPFLKWSRDDPRWNWVLIQPIRGASNDPQANAGYFSSLATLLRHGIDPNVTSRGETALHFVAARAGLPGPDRARFAALLIDHGAALSVRDDLLKSTPLGWACRWGHIDLARHLLSRGAAVHEPDAESWATPLEWAKKMNHPEIVRLLQDKKNGSLPFRERAETSPNLSSN